MGEKTSRTRVWGTKRSELYHTPFSLFPPSAPFNFFACSYGHDGQSLAASEVACHLWPQEHLGIATYTGPTRAVTNSTRAVTNSTRAVTNPTPAVTSPTVPVNSSESIGTNMKMQTQMRTPMWDNQQEYANSTESLRQFISWIMLSLLYIFLC